MWEPTDHLILTAQDVQIDRLENQQLLKIHLKHSKTNPFRTGTDVFMCVN